MSAVVISFGDTVHSTLEVGESRTFACKGRILSFNSHLKITFNSEGYYTYGGLITIGSSGKSRVLECRGKLMSTDVVIVKGVYVKID